MQKTLKNLLQNEIDPAFAQRAEFILSSIEKEKPKKILDIGCGRGFYLHAVSVFDFPKQIEGVEINESYLGKAREIALDSRIHMTHGSIYDLPFPSNSFDFIICSEVLEHLQDEKKALQEIRRVLKPGGSVVITVPHENFPFFWDPINWTLMHFLRTHIDKDLWWLAGIWAGHERLYSQQSLEKVVKANSFKISSIKRFVHNSFPFSHFLLYGIGKNIVERLHMKTFSRFSNSSNSGIRRFIADCMRFPSRFDSKDLSRASYVGLGVTLSK